MAYLDEGYAELAAATHFSFLRGASSPAAMVTRALELGLAGLGIADRNSVAGVVRAWRALRDLREGGETRPFQLVVGARLVFADGTPDILAYPTNRQGWGRLTRLLSTGNLRTTKGDCQLYFGDLAEACADMVLILLPDATPQRIGDIAPAPLLLAGSGPPDLAVLARFLRHRTPHIWIGAALHRRGRDKRHLAGLKSLSARSGVPLLAVNDALYAAPEDRPLQDILTCIRTGTRIDQAGRLLAANAERHLKSAAQMARLFADAPEALPAPPPPPNPLVPGVPNVDVVLLVVEPAPPPPAPPAAPPIMVVLVVL